MILTVRDPGRWHKSIGSMFPQMPGDGDVDVAAMMERMPAQMRWFGELGPLMDEAAQRMLGEGFGLGKQASAGWGPLCEFLGVEAPVDEPYPHLNDAATLQRMFATMTETNKLVSPFEPRA